MHVAWPIQYYLIKIGSVFFNAGKAYLTSDRYCQDIPSLLGASFSSKAHLDA